MERRYSKQNALLAKQCDTSEGLYHMMASATLTRGTLRRKVYQYCFFLFGYWFYNAF